MSLTNPSQLVLKQLHRLPQSLVLLNADGDPLPEQLLAAGKQIHILTPDYLNAQRINASTPQVATHFGLSHAPFTVEAAVLRIPKAREQLRYLAALACAILPTDTPVYLVGENKGGIKSAPATVEPWLGRCDKLASGSHCQLLSAKVVAHQPLDLNDWWLNYSVNTPDGELKLASLPGVFSHGELDAGTELLLEHLPAKPHGRVLDFGCGDGVIGAFLAKRNPEIELEMIDINAMALAASEQTLALNQVYGHVYASDGLGQVQGKFDLIVSNPPFHHGNEQTFDTAKRFIAQAATLLKPNGQLIIVANHHLPYGDDFAKAFGKVQILANNGKFKIYANSKNN